MSSPQPSPVPNATSTRRGLMSIGAQTFAGVKQFLDYIKLAVKTTASLPSGGSELEGSLIYNSTTKRALIHNGTEWVPVLMSVGPGDATTLAEHIASTNAHNAYKLGYTDTTVGAELEYLRSNKLSIGHLALPEGSSMVGTEPVGLLTGETVQAQLVQLDERALAACVWGGHDVNANGSKNLNGSISRTGVGVYVVTFTGLTDLQNDLAVTVSVNDNLPRVAVYAWEGTGNTLTVRVFALNGVAVDCFVSVSLQKR